MDDTLRKEAGKKSVPLVHAILKKDKKNIELLASSHIVTSLA